MTQATPLAAQEEKALAGSQAQDVRYMTPEELEAYRQMMESLPTEDDQPVDNLFSEKQQRLLADALYTSWSHSQFGKRFLVAANVGVFFEGRPTSLVPDLLVSLDVEPYPDVWAKEGRSYFNWVYGKPPDLVLEIVSNKEGEELGRKMQLYHRMRVGYYVVFDPQQLLLDTPLRIFEGTLRGWQVLEGNWLDVLELGVTLWEGTFEGITTTWLRWCDREGQLLLTGRERAERVEHELELTRQRAEQAEREREAARQRAEQAEREREAMQQQLEQLKAKLRALGIEEL